MAQKKYKLDQVAIRMVREKPLYSTEPIDSPEKAVKLLADAVRDYDREVVCIINFNSAMQPINLNICSMGAIDRAIVCPREVLKSSILSNASSVMLLHTHPSGNPQPSEQDVYITDRMQEVYKLMDIKMLDHIIIGDENYYSFTENRIMPDSQLSFTSIMEIYQMKHGLEAQREEAMSHVSEEAVYVGQNETDEAEHQEEKSPARDLAERLDAWSQDFDTYAYNDVVDDCAANIADIEAQIEAGQTDDIQEYIREVIEEGDARDSIIIRAKEILKDLEEYKPLAKVEEIEEQNYNMIDNRINNVEPKEEREAEKHGKEKKSITVDKKYPDASFSNFRIRKKVGVKQYSLIADVRNKDGEILKDQVLSDFKDKAAVIELCKQNDIAYDDITNYLQNMIEHKKQKVKEKKDDAPDKAGPELGKKGKGVGIDDK